MPGSVFWQSLMPIVTGLSGNSGTQTLTVITHGIALGEFSIHNTWKAIVKEISVGLINAIIISSLVCLMAYLFKFDPLLGVILGAAMVSSMFIAGLVGSLIPIVLKATRVDPALLLPCSQISVVMPVFLDWLHFL